jgi:hypothetical protein
MLAWAKRKTLSPKQPEQKWLKVKSDKAPA